MAHQYLENKQKKKATKGRLRSRHWKKEKHDNVADSRAVFLGREWSTLPNCEKYRKWEQRHDWIWLAGGHITNLYKSGFSGLAGTETWLEMDWEDNSSRNGIHGEREQKWQGMRSQEKLLNGCYKDMLVHQWERAKERQEQMTSRWRSLSWNPAVLALNRMRLPQPNPPQVHFGRCTFLDQRQFMVNSNSISASHTYTPIHREKQTT